MAKKRKNTFTRKTIDAVFGTPLIILSANKRTRRKAAKKWFDLMSYASKH